MKSLDAKKDGCTMVFSTDKMESQCLPRSSLKDGWFAQHVSVHIQTYYIYGTAEVVNYLWTDRRRVRHQR